MKIIADDKIPYLQGAFEPVAEIKYMPGSDISNTDLQDVDALIIRTRTKCNSSLLNNTKVKFIASATIGFDHIDTDYCEDNNIFWTNAPGCNSGSVQQYIASLLVFLSNKHNFLLKEKTIGIVGVGNVGTKIAAVAQAFGMKVLLNDPPRERKEGREEFVSIEKVKAEADIITFHVPLNKDGVDKTFHLANDNFINDLKEDVIIINSSRGEVVNNLALKNALSSNKIKAAALDVWENEPDIDLELLKLVDIASPHIAGYSKDGKSIGTTMSVHATSKRFSLGLENWQPKGVEKPKEENIIIDAKGLSEEEVIKNVVWKTFKISDDDRTLKDSPTTFEKQRGNYPVRRDFTAYSVEIKNDINNISEKLRTIGFRI